VSVFHIGFLPIDLRGSGALPVIRKPGFGRNGIGGTILGLWDGATLTDILNV